MTGDGAVVRKPFKLDEAEIAKAREAADQLRCGYRPGEMSTTRLRYLGHLERLQAAEIERLNSAVRSRNGEVRNLSEMLANAATRGDAAEARTADLLKALEKYGRHLKGECKKWEPRSTAANAHWYFNDAMPCTCGLAAAKGETV